MADVPTTNTFSTETINLEEISSLSSIVEITSNYNNNLKAGSTMDEPISQQRPAVGHYVAVDPIDSQEAAPEPGHKKQVVGFESTMDDGIPTRNWKATYRTWSTRTAKNKTDELFRY